MYGQYHKTIDDYQKTGRRDIENLFDELTTTTIMTINDKGISLYYFSNKTMMYAVWEKQHQPLGYQTQVTPLSLRQGCFNHA